MVYGAELVLLPPPPPEVTMDSLRVQAYDEATQDQLCREDIDLIDERRRQSAIKMHGTASHSNATKSGSCASESSKWMIWCCDGCLLKKELTSSPSAGRAPFV
jgi:hypothetical protein